MKYIFKVMIFTTIILLSTSCNGFLDKGPLTNPTAQGFLTDRPKCENYINGLYRAIPAYSQWGLGMLQEDINSDNMVSIEYNKRLNGEININDSQTEWTNLYNKIRSINYFIHFYKIPESIQDKYTQSLLGEAYFLRAWWSFNLLRDFGKVPIPKELWDNNATLSGLQIPAGTRGEMTDFILSDLTKAKELLLPRSIFKGLRINKEAALTLAMNVALFEGSWEYYHKNDAFAAKTDRSTEFLSDVLKFGDELMNMNTIQLYTIPNDKNGEAFAKLFNSNDLSNISEALLWKKFSLEAGTYNKISSLLAAGVCGGAPAGITQSLVDNYLNQDGSFTNTKIEDYKDFIKEFRNRDPRLLQTVMHEGCIFRDTTKNLSKPVHLARYIDLPKDTTILSTVEKEQYKKDKAFNEKISAPRLNSTGNQQNLTGYHIRLGINPLYKSGNSDQAQPILRYSEALLDYAEAAAILGKADDIVLNKTLKLVQERAGVTYIKPVELDPHYPSFGYKITPIMQAIRRERRSEFALQGKRIIDILRWNAAEALIKDHKCKGAWLGENSLLLNSFSPGTREDLLSTDKGVKLDENHRLEPLKQKLPNGYQFNVGRDYLLPIPTNELSLDKKLEQNPGW